jgi:tRNA G26 N,N-dimethylase Trm1
MTIETIPRIIERIKMSPPSRPIPVFVVNQKEGKKVIRKLDAIYGNTTEAISRQVALKPYHPSDKCKECGHITTVLAEEWIGDFHNRMNLEEIRTFFARAIDLNLDILES